MDLNSHRLSYLLIHTDIDRDINGSKTISIFISIGGPSHQLAALLVTGDAIKNTWKKSHLQSSK